MLVQALARGGGFRLQPVDGGGGALRLGLAGIQFALRDVVGPRQALGPFDALSGVGQIGLRLRDRGARPGHVVTGQRIVQRDQCVARRNPGA